MTFSYIFMLINCSIKSAFPSHFRRVDRIHRDYTGFNLDVSPFLRNIARPERSPIAECNNVTRNCRRQRKYNDEDDDDDNDDGYMPQVVCIVSPHTHTDTEQVVSTYTRVYPGDAEDDVVVDVLKVDVAVEVDRGLIADKGAWTELSRAEPVEPLAYPPDPTNSSSLYGHGPGSTRRRSSVYITKPRNGSTSNGTMKRESARHLLARQRLRRVALRQVMIDANQALPDEALLPDWISPQPDPETEHASGDMQLLDSDICCLY